MVAGAEVVAAAEFLDDVRKRLRLEKRDLEVGRVRVVEGAGAATVASAFSSLFLLRREKRERGRKRRLLVVVAAGARVGAAVALSSTAVLKHTVGRIQ